MLYMGHFYYFVKRLCLLLFNNYHVCINNSPGTKLIDGESATFSSL